MDAPPVQYTRTPGGVRIAYSSMGDGPPLVIPPVLFTCHLQMIWQNSEYRSAFERLAERCRVIRYDSRGSGMSQRDALDFSMDAAVEDLEAVVDRLGLEQIALYNDWRMGSVAFAYAARHPDRVSHLIHWWRPQPHASTVLFSRQAAIAPIMETDWEMYTEIWSRVVIGWDAPDANRMAASVRAAHSPASFRLLGPAVRERTPEPYLAAITAPVLILYPLEDEESEQGDGSLAAGLATAHVLGIPTAKRQAGIGFSPFPNDIGIQAILDFVCSEHDLGAVVPPSKLNTNSFRTILFTDLSDHTAMMQRLGDSRGRDLLREHERITRATLSAHAGTEIKAMGDGFMASFGSTQKALECAIALQRAFEAKFPSAGPEPAAGRATPSAHPEPAAGRARSSAHPEPVEGRAGHEAASGAVRLHIGINAGEPIEEDDDLFGSSVILAARTAAKARAGQILVTNVVRELVAGKGFMFSDTGEFEMKGFEEPVRLFELKWDA